jgi:hypothetical protein
MSNVISQDALGTVITLECGVDLSEALSVAIRVFKPGAIEAVTWPGTASGTTVSHTVIAGDLDVTGTYIIQAYVELPGWSGTGETTTLLVEAHASASPSSGLFADLAGAVVDLKASRLASMPGGLANLPDAEILASLVAAEADAERSLRVFLSPTVVLPDLATQAEKDALDEAGTRWIEEPGYDLEPDFFQGNRWGYVVLNHCPVISVQSLKFVYPAPATTVWDVPAEWIRLDKRFGHLRLVPSGSLVTAPLSVFAVQLLGGGRVVPQAVQARYTSGLSHAARDYPDLLDLVRRMAMLKLMQGAFLPTSGSLSVDGLSESQSFDLSKYQDDVDSRLERLRQSIHGIRATFL